MSDEPTRAPEARRRPASRYSLFVGIAFLIVIVVATVNTLRNRDAASSAPSQDDRGDPLPEFAVPDAARRARGRRERLPGRLRDRRQPVPGRRSRTPACEIDVRARSASATSSTGRW